MLPLLLLLLSIETSPDGEALLHFTLDRPASIAAAELDIELDEAVFGDITAFAISGAAGDHSGVATLDGRRARIWFGSLSGSIGRIADRPILTVKVPLLGKPSFEAVKLAVRPFTWYANPGQYYEIDFAEAPVPLNLPPMQFDVVRADGSLLVLPKQRLSTAESGIFRTFVPGGLALRNPHEFPVEALFQTIGVTRSDAANERRILLSPHETFYQDVRLANGYAQVLATADLEMVHLRRAIAFTGETQSLTTVSMRPIGAPTVEFDAWPKVLSFTWQPGAPLPTPQLINYLLRPATPIAHPQLRTTSSARWLNVTPSADTRQGTLTVSLDPRGLDPGVYRAAINIDPIGTTFFPTGASSVIGVVLTVAPGPQSKIAATTMAFTQFGLEGYTSIDPTRPFTATVVPNIPLNWLSVSNAAMPGSVAVAANGHILGPGVYAGHVVLRGPEATDVIQVTSRIPGAPLIEAGGPIRFVMADKGQAPPPQQIAVRSSIPFNTRFQTDSGGNWLNVSTSPTALTIGVNPTGLSAGAYTALVTLFSPAAAGPTQIPVALLIHPAIVSPLIPDPPLIELRAIPDTVLSPTFIFMSSGLKLDALQWKLETDSGPGWLRLESIPSNSWIQQVEFNLANLRPGVYTARIVASTSLQTVTIPVRLTIVQPPAVPRAPYVGPILNGASFRETNLVPGELIMIFGNEISSVTFDGIPVPLPVPPALPQIVVPHQIAGRPTVTVRFESFAGFTEQIVPLAPAAPGLFTIDSSGKGQVLARNGNGTDNGPDTPAARNAVVWIQATGVKPDDITIQIGSTRIPILHTFPVGDATPGGQWVEFQLPADTPTGKQPVVLHSVGASSQPGVFIHIE